MFLTVEVIIEIPFILSWVCIVSLLLGSEALRLGEDPTPPWDASAAAADAESRGTGAKVDAHKCFPCPFVSSWLTQFCSCVWLRLLVWVRCGACLGGAEIEVPQALLQ